MNVNQLTKAEFKRRGWVGEKVEYYITGTRKTKDYFGCIDFIAVDPVHKIVAGIQSTSGDNHNARVKKVAGIKKIYPWLQAGCILEVWSWKMNISTRRYEMRRTSFKLSTSGDLLVNDVI